MKKFIMPVLMSSLFVFACSDVRPMSYEQPVLTFEHIQPRPVPVATLTFVDEYQAPMRDDHVDHLMVNSPKETVKRYLNHKIQTAQYGGDFKFIITDASVKIRDASEKDKYVGWFTVNPSKEYAASLVVRAEYAPDGFLTKTFTIKAERTMVISNSASMVEREKAQFDLMEGLMRGFDARFNEVLLDLN